MCKTEQEQNKLEKQDLKQEQKKQKTKKKKKNSSWQGTAHWMYKDSTIVRELTRHRCGLGSIFRPTQRKRNLKIVLNFVISSPPCYRFLFFFLSSLVLYTGYLNKPSNFKFEWETLDNEPPHGSANAEI